MWVQRTGRLFAPEGVGGGSPGAAPEGGEGAHPVVAAPWAGVAEGPWKVGEAGKEREWWDTIPEEPVREHVKAKGYRNPAELAMANWSLTKMQRGASDVLTIPGEGASENDWNAFYTKLGRPAAPGDYDFKLAADAQVDTATVEFGKNLFHKLGIPASKAPEGAKMWQEFVATQNEAALRAEQEKNAEAVTKLEAEWGSKLNENRAAGERAMRALGLNADTMNAIEDKIGTAPLIELLAKIGLKSAEAPIIDGKGGNPNDPASMTKEQATAEIQRLNADAEFQKAYTSNTHDGHKAAVDRMAALYART